MATTVYLVNWNEDGETINVGICISENEASSLCDSLLKYCSCTLQKDMRGVNCTYEEIPLFATNTKKIKEIYKVIDAEVKLNDALVNHFEAMTKIQDTNTNLQPKHSHE
jgi:hypothetical protein